MTFRSLNLEPRYQGDTLGAQLIQPLMKSASSVDAISCFFSLNGLKAISLGIERLHRVKGTFRIVMSLQDAAGSPFVKVLKDADQLRPLIDEVARKIKSEAITVSDALMRESLATLGWMLREGLLQIKVAAVKSDNGSESQWGVFHQKAFIFWSSSDRKGEAISTEGSMNFTENGMEWNSESLTVFKSWYAPEYFNSTVSNFDRVWADQDPGLIVRDLDKNIADEIADTLIPLAIKTQQNPVPEIVKLLRSSPEFARYNCSKVALYPHQERALSDAMSRSPIRVMFSDDVGLGKTIEAAAALRYGLNYLGWKKVVLMVPAGLAVQWVSELYEKFGINAKRLDSETRKILDYRDNIISEAFADWGDGVFVVSAQLVSRSPDYRQKFLNEVSSTDCLVVDEAHSARRRFDLSGRPIETLIFKLLRDVSVTVRNLMLLTATPMQSQQEELVSLLEQLGLPDRWKQRNFFQNYHELLRKNEFDVEDGTLLEVGATESRIINKALPPIDAYAIVPNADLFRKAVVRSAVTPSLIIRNTRNALKQIGYNFPERKVLPSEITLSESARGVFDSIEKYLRLDFGRTEEIIFGTENALGFLYTTYFQRIVSSFNSAHCTLVKRRNRLKEWLENDFKNAVPLEGDPDDTENVQFTSRDLSDNDVKQARINCNRELTSLEPIVNNLAKFAGSNAKFDPKLQKLKSIVSELLSTGDSFLIFSKYTDTTTAVVELIEPIFRAANVGFAYYSGSSCWLNIGQTEIDSNKNEVVDALRSGRIKVVICTDAASEGLNLQSASHLINVDVPWNPARLEQRFGRIDRLGQKSKIVTFYNLWYPGSIEERMYGRILERGAEIGFSVGVMSDTVGTAIRSQLARRNSAASVDIETSLADVQRLQDSLNLTAIEETCAGASKIDSVSQLFRQRLIQIGAYLPDYKMVGSTLSSASNFLSSDLNDYRATPVTVHSLPFESLLPRIVPGHESEILILEKSGVPICLVHRLEGKCCVLGPVETVDCLLSLVSGENFSPKGDVDFTDNTIDGGSLNYILKIKFPGRIDSNALDFNSVLGFSRKTLEAENVPISFRCIGTVKSN